MGRSLVIVESPAKAKTINKYLGKAFLVKSSMGHIRDLPESGATVDGEAAEPGATAAGKTRTKARTPGQAVVDKAQRAWQSLVRRMGVDPEHGWTAQYLIKPGKEKILAELREAALDADTIYLATDLDREGEAIAWHLREAIGGDPGRYRRVVFSEITKAAIQKAFSVPGDLNLDRVHSQQARRFLDRVVGYLLSPLLWSKVARGLSAGRVQSVATRLVVEREREVRAFNPEEYWELHADLIAAPTADRPAAAIRAAVMRQGGLPFRPVSKSQIDAALAGLTGAVYTVQAREDKPSRSTPNAPFITSTLQQAASVRLGFSVKKTMTLAQRLYEAGHITYMRTDATSLSAEAVTACRDLIAKEHGDAYLPAKATVYSSQEGAQEAHEAIRPTDVRVTVGDLPALEADEARLYDLIWRQFVACQMSPAEFDNAAVTISAGSCELRANGRVMRFDGWMRVLPPARRDDVVLPALKVGEVLGLEGLDPSQHFTKAPPRYSEASLVKELEKKGIGRPSTYASIISTIQERGYVRLTNRRLHAEKLGGIVTDRLVASFADLLDYGFTAELEGQLDEVAHARQQWTSVLDTFYTGFKRKLADAEGHMAANPPIPTSITCPDCARPMAVRTGRTGVFLSCTGYQLPPKERCTKTLNLVPGEEIVATGDPEAEMTPAEVSALRNQRRCQVCSSPMDSYLVDEKRRMHVCTRNPDCPGVEIEAGSFRIKGYDGPIIVCDKCGADMQLRSGRFGKYFACTGPACRNTRKLLRNGEAAPPKAAAVPMPELPCTRSDGHFVLRDGAAGIFLAASTYPRSRETRSPLVEDLARHRSELDPKFLHLADAPPRDPAGNPAMIRFSRKNRAHYLMSEVDGEPTGWTLVHQDGTWVPGPSGPGTARTPRRRGTPPVPAKS